MRSRWVLPPPTYPERVFYNALRQNNIKFQSQFWVGRYRADAYIPSCHLLIEVDGEYWHSRPKQRIKDKLKNAFYKGQGYNLLRIPAKQLIKDPGKWIRLIQGFQLVYKGEIAVKEN